MQKEIKAYLSYVKKLSYNDRVAEGQKYWRQIVLENISNLPGDQNKQTATNTLFFHLYFTSISDFTCDSIEVKFISDISNCPAKEISNVFDRTRQAYYDMNMSEKANFLNQINHNTVAIFRTKAEATALLKVIALVLAADEKVSFMENKHLSNTIDLFKNF